MVSCQRYAPVILLLGLVSFGRADDLRAAESAAPARREAAPDRPAPDPRVRQPSAVVEVGARAGTPFYASDVVIVIDNSTLALVASGIDVDQDGVVGRNRSQATERR